MSRERLRQSLIRESTNLSVEWKLTSIVIKSSGFFSERTWRLKQSEIISLARLSWRSTLDLFCIVLRLCLNLDKGRRAKALGLLLQPVWSTNRLSVQSTNRHDKAFWWLHSERRGKAKCGWLVAVIGTNWIALALTEVNFQFYTVSLEFRYAKAGYDKWFECSIKSMEMSTCCKLTATCWTLEGLQAPSVDFRLMSIKATAMPVC